MDTREDDGRRVHKLTGPDDATVDGIPCAIPELGAPQKANALRSSPFGLELVKKGAGVRERIRNSQNSVGKAVDQCVAVSRLLPRTVAPFFGLRV